MRSTSPKRIAERLARVVTAWETLSPTKTFAGMTLDQFKAKVHDSQVAREQLDSLRSQATQSRTERRQADEAALGLTQLVVNAVKGDPEEGENGSLYTAMGYVPKSARRSGLTRMGLATPPAEVAAVK